MSSLVWECEVCEEPRYSAQMIYCLSCQGYVGFCHGKKWSNGPKHDGGLACGLCKNCEAKLGLVRE